ncbi:MAG: DUF4198 domain-containing protein [Thermodesulfobacteriota bacterium]|nr:DUF4198 domain-containing protein [Thermodesulfobacteriota bacterium]
MRKNRQKFFLCIFSICVCFFVNSEPVVAHDLWLNVDNYYPEAGRKATVKAVFGHNFPYYDILIGREGLAEFSYLGPDGQKREITKTWEDKTGERSGALVGEFIAAQKGTYVVTAYRKVKGDKEHVASEKYAKSIISAGEGESNISGPFGHRIEIVPLKDPKEIKPGDAIPVRLLFEGRPLSTYLYATYAGYYSEDEPFPFFTKSNEEGVAYIRISQPGIWMVVSNHKVDFSASLTFEIK